MAVVTEGQSIRIEVLPYTVPSGLIHCPSCDQVPAERFAYRVVGSTAYNGTSAYFLELGGRVQRFIIFIKDGVWYYRTESGLTQQDWHDWPDYAIEVTAA